MSQQDDHIMNSILQVHFVTLLYLLLPTLERRYLRVKTYFLRPLAILLALGDPLAFADEPSDPSSCKLHPVMIEDFIMSSIAPSRIDPARWIAHTPWGGDFGDAKFADPGPSGPFEVRDGVLAITASKDRTGQWTSGLIAAADSSGAGTGTRYGYFEVRMKIPPGPGTWPAFWLASLKPATSSAANVEIDVVEYYGQFTSAYRAAIHVWDKDQTRNKGSGEKVDVLDGSLVSDYHTFGVDVSPQALVFLLDGKQVWRQPTPSELDGPMYPIVDLALGSGWSIAKTPNPSTLLVDYVHIYGRGAGPREGCSVGLPK